MGAWTASGRGAPAATSPSSTPRAPAIRGRRPATRRASSAPRTAPTSSTPAGRGEPSSLWKAAGEEWGEPLFHEAGCLWFAAPRGRLRGRLGIDPPGEGIPVDRLTPAEVAERWPHMAVDDLAFALLRARGGTALRPTRRGDGRRGVRRGRRAFELATARPGRARASASVGRRAPTGRRSRRRTSSSPAGRGCRGCSRRSSATSSG